jgi:hypothetical protein
MDEVGFWYSDPDAANPDIEVENAIKFAQIQFPHYKRIGISTPWTKQGLLWQYYNAGTDGEKLISREKYKGVLVHYAPTAAMQNPLLSQKALKRIQASDPAVFERESLAKFIDSVSGFLPEVIIRQAVTQGIRVRNPDIINCNYVAAIDPAFRHDSFAFAICHREKSNRIVLDVVLRWKPEKTQRLNPKLIIDELLPWLRAFNIQTVHSDQYQLESLQQIALDKGIAINGMDFTSKSKAKMYGDLETLFKTKRLDLLDPELSIAMNELIQELIRLEKKSLSSGVVQITAPQGHHDDLATVLTLAAHMALRYAPPSVEEKKDKTTLLSQYLDMLQERKEQYASSD